MPKVSVIIPCFNQGAYLDEAVDSVLAQTFEDLEIVVVDDGSTDPATVAKLAAYERPKTRVVHTPNLGLPGARNLGIRESRGAYLLPLDADDRIAPTYVEQAAAVLDASPGTGIVYCRAELFGDEEGPWALPPFRLPDGLVSPCIFASALFRRSDWEAAGGYCETMRSGLEDHDLWLSLLERGAAVHRLDETLFHYRRTAASMSRHYTPEQLHALLDACIRRHRPLFERHFEGICHLAFDAGERARHREPAAPPDGGRPPSARRAGSPLARLPGLARVRALFPYVRVYRGRGWHVALEDFATGAGRLRLDGWAFHERGAARRAVLAHGAARTALAWGRPRGDVADVHPRFASAARSGLVGSAPLEASPGAPRLELEAGDTSLSLRLPRPARLRAGRLAATLAAVTPARAGKAVLWLLQGKPGLVAAEVRRLAHVPDRRAETGELARVLDAWETGTAPAAADGGFDVIVPVYNGAAFLPRFLESLRAHTGPRHRVILVEDASTDPAVLPLLEAFCKGRPGTVLLRHDVNRGFVASVNEGARRARGHFAIVNTDVELPGGWLERLMAPILRDPLVASATPFTDGGTLNAFPEIGRDNELPDGATPGEVDAVFRRVDAARLRIEAPTGMGFCMGFRAEAVRAIGRFDEEAFGRGYAEENDWCLRARAAGYTHLLVPNLFVHHAHTGSFGREKQALLERNLAVLRRRHPGYDRLTGDFFRLDPPGVLRRFLLFRLLAERAGDRLRVIVDHDMGGGANAYRDEWIRRHADAGDTVVALLYAARERAYRLALRRGALEAVLWAADLDAVFRVLGGLRPAEAWYNCAVTFPDPLDLAARLRAWRRGAAAKLIVAVEDFFPLCPSFDLLDRDGRFCGVPDRAACRACLPGNPFTEGDVPRDIDAWRDAWGAVLADADEVVCFSEDSAKWVRRAYPDLGEKPRFRIEPHELEPAGVRVPRVRAGGPLHVGIVGGVNHAKGLEVIEAMAAAVRRRGLDARITVIGVTARPVSRRIRVTGPYRRERLPDLVERHGVNVAVFPSVWPETFSRVAEELMHMRLPIAAFDLGAPAERLRRYPRARLAERVDAEALLDAALALHADAGGPAVP